MNKIEELELKISELANELNELKKTQEDVDDHSNWIGRLVMVSDDAEEDVNGEWFGPLELLDIDFDDDYPYIAGAGAGFKYCKLYEGPFRINMAKWEGGKCPVNEYDLVIATVDANEGIKHVIDRAYNLFWEEYDNLKGVVNNYAVLEIYHD